MQKIITHMTILSNEDGNSKRHIIKEPISGYEYLLYQKISVCLYFDGDFWSATDCLTGYAITPRYDKRSQVITKLIELQKDITLEQYQEQQKRALARTQELIDKSV